MPSLPATRRRQRRGAVAVQVILSLTAFMGVMAIALDGGVLMTEKRHAQATADAAARAAAIQLGSDSSPYTTSKQVATNIGQANYSDTSHLTVTTNIPPLSGTFSDTSKYPAGQYAESIVEWDQTRYFSAIFGTGAIPVKARAVARLQSSGNVGFLVLGPSGTTVTMSGTANLDVVDGTFITDSTGSKVFNDSSSLKSTANQFIFSSTQPNLGITNPNSLLQGPSGATPTITYSATPTPDPLASLAAPTIGTPQADPKYGGSTIGQLSPGTYTALTVGGSANVTLQSGVYYINGDFNWNSSGTLNATSGVMIYVTGKIAVTSGTIDINPMTSGTYAGLSLWQAAPATGTLSMKLSGGSGWNVNGTIYGPKSDLNLSGSSSGTADTRGSQIMVNDVTLSGSSTINVNADGAKAYNKSSGTLVE